jgi:hypothetical protein
VVGGIYSPNHQTRRLVEAAVVWRTGHCPVCHHVTQPLGFDRWSFCLLGHRTIRWCTGQSLYTVRCAFCRCSDSGAHCSALNAFYRRSLARSSRCSAGTSDSPVVHRTVRWIIAERLPEFPKVASSELDSLVHRTLSGGTPDSPVRQTRAHFGCLLLPLFEPFLLTCIGLLWTFGTCRTHNLEQTS